MPIVGLRVHVAIADSRQGLDGEVEKLQRTVVGNVGDRLVAEEIQESKYGVEQDEEERRPLPKNTGQ